MDPHDRYGYEEAVSARMEKFEGDFQVCEMDSDGEDITYASVTGYRIPDPIRRQICNAALG